MSDPKKKWSYLMMQYFKDKITPSELAELNAQRAASPVKDNQFLRLTSLPYLIKTVCSMDKFDVEASWKEILEKANCSNEQRGKAE